LGITPTQLFSTSGDCVTRTYRYEENASAFANSTAQGKSFASSTAFGYRVTPIPACLNGGVSIPPTFGGATFQGSGSIFKPATSALPSSIVEVEVEQMKYNNLYR
jgi:hypothetical protein